MPEPRQKSIENKVCGFYGCAKPATIRVAFQLGFSVRFCDECGHLMIREGLGKCRD
jgi:hypothetical protein